MADHRWAESDDILALYVFKYGNVKLPLPLDALLRARGIEPGSFRMRVGNFRAIAGEAGLSNYARQSKEVFDRYGSLSEPQLRSRILGS